MAIHYKLFLQNSENKQIEVGKVKKMIDGKRHVSNIHVNLVCYESLVIIYIILIKY